MQIGKVFLLVSLFATSAMAAGPCYNGEFNYEGMKMSFQVRTNAQNVITFNSTVLNPDDVIPMGDGTSKKVSEMMTPDKDLVMEKLSPRCPCIAYGTSDGKVAIEMETLSGGNELPNMTYFSLGSVFPTKFSSCSE
jgi:hypothetical protein